jgi:CRISPR-associated protein Csx10
MTIQLKFAIELHSDYHISAGHGQGAALDSALQRDGDGVPSIRGTSITGLLREGLRALAEETALGQSPTWQQAWETVNEQRWQGSRAAQPGDLLFGAPNQPKSWQISTARPTGLLSPQRSVERQQAAHAVAHVRVDPATRRAEARKLFVREEGDQRLLFHFTATALRNDGDVCEQATLLLAAARMVTALGAHRRRGQGACTIHLTEVVGWPLAAGGAAPTQAELLNDFEAYWLAEKKHRRQTNVAHPPVIQPATGVGLRFWLLLRSDEPLLIARRAAAGNQFEGLDGIPGYTMRGALARRIVNRHALAPAAGAVYETFVRLFYRGGIHCSALSVAYLNEKYGDAITPTIPAPLDLFVSEQHPGRGDLPQSGQQPLSAQQAAAQDFKVEDGNGPLKIDPVKGFLAVRPKAPIVHAQKQGEMHVTIDPKTGRAQDRELFGYVALASGQYFIGEIRCATAGDWQNLAALAELPLPDAEGVSAPFTLRLGKAQRRGYGQVTATLIPVAEETPALWAGLPIEERVTDPTAPLTLTLVSDTIVLDAWGRSYQEFTPAWLQETIGVAVTIEEVTGFSGTKHKLHFARSRLVDTFDNNIGLPRTRDIVLVAGSAVTLRVQEALPLADLQTKLNALEERGVGMRRHEGFGRLVFNHPVYQDAAQAVAVGQLPLPPALQLGDTANATLWGDEGAWKQRWMTTMTEAADLWRKLRALKAGKRNQFGGLVRELAAGTTPNLTAFHTLLARYGDADLLLPQGLPGRQKPNFFRTEGKPILDLLTTLLTTLHEQAGDANDRWLLGCRLLADQLAVSLADQKEKAR